MLHREGGGDKETERERRDREREVSHLQHAEWEITEKQLCANGNFEQSQAEFIHVWVLQNPLVHIPGALVQINVFYSQLCIEMV